MARPSVITEAFTQRVCARVRAGLRLQSALEAEGVDKRNAEYWKREAERGNQLYSEFLAAVARARAEFEAETLDVIRLQATPTDNGEIQDWKARALPAKPKPKQWRRCIRSTVSAPSDRRLRPPNRFPPTSRITPHWIIRPDCMAPPRDRSP